MLSVNTASIIPAVNHRMTGLFRKTEFVTMLQIKEIK